MTPIVHPGSLRIAVAEPSQVGEARRAAAALAASLGFDEERSGRVALAATEAATNIVKHGRTGELLLRALHDAPGVELLALDRGEGIRDIARALADGFSTAGSPGTGLGAIRRMADEFDLWSAPGAGTALVARLRADGRPHAPAPFAVGVAQLPKGREERCGDAWSMTVRESGDVLFMVADGLGHGPAAADAASEAARIFRGQAGRAPREILEVAHAALRHTRGAAVSVALVSRADGVVRYAGIGNVAAQIVDRGAGTRSLVSLNGIVGHEVRRVQEFSYPWPADALLLMYSDGLVSHWKLEDYPGLATRDPALVAGVLYRDFCRGRDDVTVLAARAAGAAP